MLYDVVEDSEVLVLKAINGELDMHSSHINSLANKPLFSDHRESGDYRFFDMTPTFMNTTVISLNMTHPDPVKREVYANHDFRVGLSHAIDRDEIIDIVYVGQAEPFQTSPRPESEFYNERLATQYLEYDPELAEELLDRAGFGRRDGAGYRLGPDGGRITVDIDVALGLRDDWSDVVELVAEHWNAVGVEARLNAMDRSLFNVRVGSNEHDAAVWEGGGGLDVLLQPRFYFPHSTGSYYAVAWANWYNQDADAEEPSEAARRQMQLYDQLMSTAEPDEQAGYMHDILDIAAEEFYAIGVAMLPDIYGIVRNDFRNVPEWMPDAWWWPRPAPTNPEQYFIEQP